MLTEASVILSVWTMDIALDQNRTHLGTSVNCWIESTTIDAALNDLYVTGMAALSYTLALHEDFFDGTPMLFPEKLSTIAAYAPSHEKWNQKEMIKTVDNRLVDAFLRNKEFINPQVLFNHYIGAFSGCRQEMLLYLLYMLAVAGCLSTSRVVVVVDGSLGGGTKETICALDALNWACRMVFDGITPDNCANRLLLKRSGGDYGRHIVDVFTYLKTQFVRNKPRWNPRTIQTPVAEPVYRMPTLESIFDMVIAPSSQKRARSMPATSCVPLGVRG
jgi:hypothetical protein